MKHKFLNFYYITAAPAYVEYMLTVEGFTCDVPTFWTI